MPIKYRTLILYTLMFCLCNLVATTSLAAKNEKLHVEAYKEENFIRFLFHCKQPVSFQPEIKGNQFSVRFNRRFDIDFGNIKQTMGDIIAETKKGSATRTASFLLKNNKTTYTLRHFVSEEFVGVDLIPLSKKASILAKKTKIETKKRLKARKKKEKEKIEKEKLAQTRRLVFPWKEKNIEAAIFTRDSVLWVVFDRLKKYNIDSFLERHGDVILDGEQINNRYYTILRFEMTQPFYISPRKTESDWIVTLLDKPVPTRLPIVVIPEFRSPPGPYLLIKSFPDNQPVRIIDPNIGDELLILPLPKPGNGIAGIYKFIDFALLPSAQGIVLQPAADNVQLHFRKKGLEITSPSLSLFRETQMDTPRPMGHPLQLKVSEPSKKTDLYKETPVYTRAQDYSIHSIFPFNEWHNGDDSAFSADKNALEHTIFFDSLPDALSSDRLRLAKFYLANKMASEAFSILQYLETIDPPFMQTEQARRIKALTLYLLRRYKKSKNIFATLTAENNEEEPEIKFWQNALRATLNKQATLPPNYYPHRNTFLAHYPLWLQQQLLLKELEFHVSNRSISNAEALLELAIGLNVNGKITNDITFLKGLILAQKGEADEAISTWDVLVSDALDPRNRARAEFGIMEVLFRENKITNTETIDRLNRIRFMWRGDELELNVLKILGQLYIDKKQYAEGLRVWKNIVTYYPNSPEALFIAKRIIQTFVYLFNQGGAAHYTPLEALAFYYEFKEWTPIGKSGEIMIKNLVDRLYKIDLLDQAAALLTHQVRYRLHGTDKIRIGTKLALVHLLNKSPELALEVLEALEETDDEFSHIAQKRKYLKAQAFLELARYDESLQTLADDQTHTANTIRQDVYWRTKQWNKAATILTPNVNTSARGSQTLSFKESNELLRLTIIRSMQKDWKALEKLYKTFNKRVPEKHNHKKIFEFFAGKLDPINHKDLSTTLQLDDFGNLLNSFRDTPTDETLESIAEDS